MTEHQAEEAYRSLRSTIKYAEGEQPIRTVLVVDVDRDLPSDVGQRLAAAFARGGDACAYLDANLHGAASNKPGLSDLVSGRVSICEASTEAGDQATVIGPGTVADPDLLSGPEFGRALDAISSRHDYVIISCAPLTGSGDALAVAPLVDATILTITQGVTRRQRAIDARDALDRVGANVLGLVMVERERRWWM